MESPTDKAGNFFCSNHWEGDSLNTQLFTQASPVADMPVSTRPCYKMLVAHRILCVACGAIVVLALFCASYFSIFSHMIIFLWSLMLNIWWDFVHVLEIDSVLLQTCLLFIHSWLESPGHLKIYGMEIHIFMKTMLIFTLSFNLLIFLLKGVQVSPTIWK